MSPNPREMTDTLMSKFQRFLGLTEVQIKPKLRRNLQTYDEVDIDEDDSDGELDVDMKASENEKPVTETSAEIKAENLPNQDMYESDESFQERIKRERMKREFLSQLFLDDPHLAIKVFFTSYFYELGLYP